MLGARRLPSPSAFPHSFSPSLFLWEPDFHLHYPHSPLGRELQGNLVCNQSWTKSMRPSPLRPQAAGRRLLPRPQLFRTGPRQASAAPASANGEKKGRGAGRFPYPSSHRPPLTCPARVRRERKISQSTSWERLGLQLCSRLLSPMVGRLSSAAAAMTPSQAAPTTTEVRSRPHPLLLLLPSLGNDVKTVSLRAVLKSHPFMWSTSTCTSQVQL